MPPKRKYGYVRNRLTGGKVRRAHAGRGASRRTRFATRTSKKAMFKRGPRAKKGSFPGSRASLAFKIVPSSCLTVNGFGGIHQRTDRQNYDTVEAGDSAILFDIWNSFALDTTVSHQKICTRNWLSEKTYSLQSNMQVNYKAYFCVARHDVPYYTSMTADTSLTDMGDYFGNGFTDYDFSAGSAIAGTFPGVTPFNNPRFVNHFKIKKVIKGSLTATRKTLRLTSKLTKPCEHLWVRYLSPSDPATGPVAPVIVGKKGLYRGWIVIFEGEPTNAADGEAGQEPSFSTAPFVIDVFEKVSVNIAIVEQNSMQFDSIGGQTNALAGIQHYNIYEEKSVPFQHNWNTFNPNA